MPPANMARSGASGSTRSSNTYSISIIIPAGTGGNTRRMLSNGTCMQYNNAPVNADGYLAKLSMFAYLVMLSMNGKVELNPESRSAWLHVEDKSMKAVFNQSPYQNTYWQQSNYSHPIQRGWCGNPRKCGGDVGCGQPHHVEAVGYPAKRHQPPRTLGATLQ